MVHRVRQEIHTWMRLPRHENVLPLYGVALGFGPLPSLVLPWMYNGTLTSYLERKPTLPYHKKLALVSTWITVRRKLSQLDMTDSASSNRTSAPPRQSHLSRGPHWCA
ncbi:hypothetical protein J3A83DRAFT_416262 [Scleroderma citrinum]